MTDDPSALAEELVRKLTIWRKLGTLAQLTVEQCDEIIACLTSLASLRQTQAGAGTCDYEDCDQELTWRHAGDGTGFCQYHVATLLHERVAYLEKALVFEQEECIRACEMQIDEFTKPDARAGIEWCINAIRARGKAGT